MNKYYITEKYEHAKYNAGKARSDIEQILEKIGYKKLVIDKPYVNIFSNIFLYLLSFFTFFKIKRQALVFFHFPVLSRRIRYLLYLCHKANINTIAHIHDFEGIRERNNQILIKEIKTLNRFKNAIVSNYEMKHFVKSKLPNIKISQLILYDYLIDKPNTLQFKTISNQIAFAGNPEKASFIFSLHQIDSLQFHIYGVNMKTEQQNIVFYEKKDPVELSNIIKGSFGLIWDGESIYTCSGKYGDYLLYNYPYKFSLYIASGLPLIIWNKSALATYVIEQNIGFTVSSLEDITDIITKTDPQTYDEWRTNVLSLRQKVITGENYKNVIQDVEIKIIC